MLTFFEGKKTYILAAIAFILGGLAAIGHPAPDYVYEMLAPLGVASLRSGQKTEAKNASLATAATIAPEATAVAMAALQKT